VSERRACRVVKQWRGTQRYLPLRRTDEDQLTQAILALAAKYGRYGYRRITALLQSAGWSVGARPSCLPEVLIMCWAYWFTS
jgi:putative transposase